MDIWSKHFIKHQTKEVTPVYSASKIGFPSFVWLVWTRLSVSIQPQVNFRRGISYLFEGAADLLQADHVSRLGQHPWPHQFTEVIKVYVPTPCSNTHTQIHSCNSIFPSTITLTFTLTQNPNLTPALKPSLNPHAVLSICADQQKCPHFPKNVFTLLIERKENCTQYLAGTI